MRHYYQQRNYSVSQDSNNVVSLSHFSHSEELKKASA